MPTDDSPLMTIAQVAEYLVVDRQTVYRLMNNGLPYVTVGTRRRIRRSDLDRYIERPEGDNYSPL